MATKIAEPPHLVADLTTLCLTSLAREWERFARTARTNRQSHADFLADAAAFEVTQRRERRIQRRLKEARFPVLKTLDGFDFQAQPGLDRDEVLDLFACDFVEKAANVVLIGGVGTGKTHLAIALGMACIQQDRRVRFTTAAELTNLLVEAKAQGRLSRKLEQIARYDAVVLDELGYVPFDRQGADLLFNFITRVYERRSLVVTTNLPFAKWSQVFGDATAAAAVIDRIVHHATVLQTKGSSYRLKDAGRKRPPRRRKEVATS
jgi:DNA replication protein DnaC